MDGTWIMSSKTSPYFWNRFEKEIIVRLFVGGLTNLARNGGKAFRYLQNGLVQFYALAFILWSCCFIFVTG